MTSKFSLIATAAEVPVGSGFAEQHGFSQAGMISYAPGSSGEVSESGDEVAEVLSAMPLGSQVSLIKGLSDVIVFGTNCVKEMVNIRRFLQRKLVM
jgi:hypothetical protein